MRATTSSRSSSVREPLPDVIAATRRPATPHADAVAARVKICGLTDAAGLDAAVRAGAAYVGLVFFPPSPRHLALDAARALALAVPPGVARVALTVDADDATFDAIAAAVPIDVHQLHGDEAPGRVAEVRSRTGLPVMKSVGLRDAADLADIARYEAVADQVLVDAKPPRGATLPGGNGVGFDWRLVADRTWARPWMLAGGLTPETVGVAIALTGARQVDVSSGVEDAPGAKSPDLIAAFCAAVEAAAAVPKDRRTD